MKKDKRTRERLLKDFSATDWKKRTLVVKLRNEGLSFMQIAKQLGTSRQAVNVMFHKMKNMSTEMNELYKTVVEPLEETAN